MRGGKQNKLNKPVSSAVKAGEDIENNDEEHDGFCS